MATALSKLSCLPVTVRLAIHGKVYNNMGWNILATNLNSIKAHRRRRIPPKGPEGKVEVEVEIDLFLCWILAARIWGRWRRGAYIVQLAHTCSCCRGAQIQNLNYHMLKHQKSYTFLSCGSAF